jgi:hypothetical protein
LQSIVHGVFPQHHQLSDSAFSLWY